MKFHALALSLVAATAATAAWASDAATTRLRTRDSINGGAAGTVRSQLVMTRDGMIREIIYPDLCPIGEVAEKVAAIVQKQQQEIAMLRTLVPRAQTAGYENISSIYDFMAKEHQTMVDHGSRWLTEHGYPAPAAPAAMTVEHTPEASIEHQIQMHADGFNRSLEAHRTERCITPRTMHLWAAATSARHLSLLYTLDRDVDFGRKNLSARLRSEMEGTYLTTNRETLVTQIVEEERALMKPEFPALVVAPPPTPPTFAQVIEVERVVERVVEKPVIQERIVEKPVIQERIVEKIVEVERVAGRRQRTRRPAK